MRILIATDTYYPDVNGAAYFTYRLATNLAKRGHDVFVMCPSRSSRNRRSRMCFGAGLQLRSSVRSNPLGPYHPVVLATWREESRVEVGTDFAMTGGTICAATRITIGNRVVVGANADFLDACMMISCRGG